MSGANGKLPVRAKQLSGVNGKLPVRAKQLSGVNGKLPVRAKQLSGVNGKLRVRAKQLSGVNGKLRVRVCCSGRPALGIAAASFSKERRKDIAESPTPRLVDFAVLRYTYRAEAYPEVLEGYSAGLPCRFREPQSTPKRGNAQNPVHLNLNNRIQLWDYRIPTINFLDFGTKSCCRFAFAMHDKKMLRSGF